MLLGISRSSVYYAPRGESAENLALLRRMDALSLQYPFYGSRQMARHLRREGVAAGRRRVRRLMRLMGLEAIYRKPRTSDAQQDHVYPYLLRELKIDRPDQVWCADITYIPVTTGFLYLVAIMDWASRQVLSWRLSNTMDSSFCVEALEAALQTGTPGIFNTDQGSQFTSAAFTDRVQAAGARCSMDGRGPGPVSAGARAPRSRPACPPCASRPIPTPTPAGRDPRAASPRRVPRLRPRGSTRAASRWPTRDDHLGQRHGGRAGARNLRPPDNQRQRLAHPDLSPLPTIVSKRWTDRDEVLALHARRVAAALPAVRTSKRTPAKGA